MESSPRRAGHFFLAKKLKCDVWSVLLHIFVCIWQGINLLVSKCSGNIYFIRNVALEDKHIRGGNKENPWLHWKTRVNLFPNDTPITCPSLSLPPKKEEKEIVPCFGKIGFLLAQSQLNTVLSVAGMGFTSQWSCGYHEWQDQGLPEGLRRVTRFTTTLGASDVFFPCRSSSSKIQSFGLRWFFQRNTI